MPYSASSSDTGIPAAYTEGVLVRRGLAWLIDIVIIGVLTFLSGLFILVLGFVTFFASWLIFPILSPLVIALYSGITLGGSNATIGMRMMDLELRRTDGGHMDSLSGMVHTGLFYLANVLLSPFVLLLGLFTTNSRLLHDMVLSTVVINRSAL